MRQNLHDSELTDSLFRGRQKFTFEERSGAGAISLETKHSYWTSTGANALTLADGTEGQEKTITLAVSGGTATITPANFGGSVSATVALVAAGDSVSFVFMKGNWWMTARASTTATLPVVA